MTGIEADIKVRMTTALRAPTHGMAWFALETGVFERHGLDVTFPAIETTGPEVAADLMRGDWDAFKTQPDVYIPVLQRFLKITDRDLAEDQYRFYVPLFERAPRLSLGDGLQSIRDVFAKTYPHAQKLQEREFVDTSVIDELERSGFIARLYGDSQ